MYEGVIIGVIALVIFVAWLYLKITNPIESKYNSENYPINNVQQNESSVLGTKYNYYLDISPSMMGFFMAGNNNMSILANVLENLNLSTHDNKFYTCSHLINNVSESVFYESMSSVTYSSQYYQNLVNRGAENNRENLETALKNLDLSKVFTEGYDDNASFDQDGTVNMIITDMNFMLEEFDLEYHNMLLERFASNLNDKVGKLNFCIYNINCQFQGTKNYDNNVEPSDGEFINNSFFIIILAQDNNVYSSYINRLEKLFNEYQINYQNNKFELKNNLFEDQNQFKMDYQRFVNLDNTTLENFNFDNKSVKKMPDNAVGVRLIKEDSNTAAIKKDSGILDMLRQGFKIAIDVLDNKELSNEAIKCEICFVDDIKEQMVEGYIFQQVPDFYGYKSTAPSFQYTSMKNQFQDTRTEKEKFCEKMNDLKQKIFQDMEGLDENPDVNVHENKDIDKIIRTNTQMVCEKVIQAMNNMRND